MNRNKKLIFILLTACALMGAGCSTTKTKYESEVTVTPKSESNKYEVKAKIYKTKDQEKRVLIIEPIIEVEKNKKGTMRSVNDNKDGVYMDTLVDESDDEINTDVLFKIIENGNEISMENKIKTNKVPK